ncbi:MAG: PTS sugar transporter subunit IIA [Spirochaetales bacterium]|nr:PTS sugar transporter subunit IIA [Spirochaetales bacterium]
MNLRKILTADVIQIGLKAKDKSGVIEELVDLLMKSGKVTDRAAALECILDRESKMSTGIQFGIAIPHGKSDVVEEMVACIAVEKKGIDFEALDAQPSTIFIMTISPEHKTGPHVQFLAEISQLLKEQESRDRILNAQTAEEIIEIFCN